MKNFLLGILGLIPLKKRKKWNFNNGTKLEGRDALRLWTHQLITQKVGATPSPPPPRNIMLDSEFKSIEIDLDEAVERRNRIIKFSKQIYTFLVFTITLILPTNSTTELFKGTFLPEEHLAPIIFQWIVPAQYLFLALYFKDNHFENTYLYIQHPCLPTSNLIFTIVFTLSFIASLAAIIRLWFGHSIYQWYNFYNSTTPQKFILSLLAFYEYFIGFSTVILSVSIFGAIIIKHTKDLNNYVESLASRGRAIDANLSPMILKLCQLRKELQESVDLLSPLFSTSTIIGAMGIASFIHYNVDGRIGSPGENFFFVHLGLWSIIQMIFFINVGKLSSSKDRLAEIVRKPMFVSRCLGRVTVQDIERFNGNNQLIMMNLLEENATTLDWMALTHDLEKKWIDFTVLGISVDDGDMIKRAMVFVSVITAIIKWF